MRLPVVLALAGALLVAGPAGAHDGAAHYRWVRAPAGVSSAPEPALGRTADLPADADSFAATEVWTGDLQLTLSLPGGALPRRPDRTGVTAAIEPVDPTTLPPLPNGIEPNGNAYRVVLADGPTAITMLSQPGRLRLAVPHHASILYWSADGRRWTALHPATDPAGGLSAKFTRSGFYLAGVALPDGGVPPWVLLLGLLPLAALLGSRVASRR